MKDQSMTKRELLEEITVLNLKIKELKKAEAKHKRESKDKLSLITENIVDCVAFVDTSGTYKYITPSYMEVLGYGPEDMIGISGFSFLHPDDFERVLNLYKDGIEQDLSEFRYETRFRHRKGHYVSLEVRTRSFRDTKGKIIGGVVCARDISERLQIDEERKRAEVGLRKVERTLNLIFDTIPAMIWQKDLEGRYLQVNNAYCETVGLPKETLLGKTDYDLYPEEIADKYANHDRKVLTSGKSEFGIEEYHKKPSGEYGWSLTDKLPFIDDGGNISGTIGFALDITSRKRAEDALLSESEFNRLVIENAGQGICVCHGIEEFPYVRFTVWNECMTLITGYSMEEINRLGWYQSMYHDPAVQERAIIRIQSMRVGDDIQDEEWEITRADGEKRQLLITTRLYTGSKSEPLVLGVINDITERKHTENKLRESEMRFRELFENESDAIMVFDAETHRFEDANAATINLYGYTREEFLALTVEDISAEPDKTQAMVARIITGDAVQMMVPIRYQKKKDGTVFPAEISPGIFFAGDRKKIIGAVRDITARKQAEEALRASEENFKLLVENSTNGIFVQTQYRFAYLNPEAVKLFGAKSADQLLGQPVLDRFDSRFHDLVRERIRLLNEEKIAVPLLEQTYLRMDGSSFDVEVTAVPIKWRDHDGAFVFFKDITERKRAVEKLQDSEARYRQLFENAPAGIYEVDLTTGRLLSVNDAMCEYTGYTKDELLTMNALDLLTEEGQKIFIERMAGYAAGEPVPSTLEYKARKKSGREFWISINPRYFYKEGIPVRASVVARDITEQKRAEDGLRESEKRFRELAELLPETIYETDIQGLLTFVNRHAFDLFGYTQEDFAGGLSALNMVTPDDRGRALENMQRIMNGENIRSDEYTLQRKDGSTFPSTIHSTVIVHDGKPVGLRGFIIDITLRKQNEEALNEKMRLSKIFIDALPCVALLLRPSTREIVASNQAAVDVGAVPGTQCFTTWAQRETPCPWCLAPSLWVNGIAQHIEVESLGIVWDAHWIPVSSDLYLHYAFNISERKQAENALRESEERFSRVTESLHEAIWSADLSGQFDFLSPAMVHIYGRPISEMKVNPDFWIEATYPEDQAAVRASKETLIRDQRVELEYRIILPDGTVRWIADRKLLLLNEHGEPSRIAGILSDITERKLAEQAQVRLVAMLDTAPGFVGYADAKDTHILYINTFGRKMVGVQPQEDVTQLKIADVHPEWANKLFRDEIIPTAIRDGMWTGECAFLNRDGHETPVIMMLLAHKSPSGEVERFSTVSIDITARKQAEAEKRILQERLHDAEKMEMLGILAGRVAHDLNNVLGVLSGYSELLTLSIPAGSPLKEHATHILKSSIKAAAIVEDLLTLTRRGVRIMEVAKFNRIIANLLATPEFDKLVAYHPNVIVRTDLAKDLLNISGSPVHLEKTVFNLVSNAVEAIAGSGEVKIKTENRYIDKSIEGYQTVAEGEYVVLTVSDTGKGIPASELKKIYEPFYTKKSMGRSGTGLGLAIVQGAVQDHSGYIDVQSTEGKGTTFTLYFPATREKAATEPQKTPMDQYMGHGETVLVVDDVKEQREVAITLFTQLGYSVNAVSSGEDAVEYLKSNKADILVLDMIMEPGIDGLDTYKLVLEINPHQKAVIVSGFSQTDRSREAQKLGAGPYVKKPYMMETIGVAIRDELGRK